MKTTKKKYLEQYAEYYALKRGLRALSDEADNIEKAGGRSTHIWNQYHEAKERIKDIEVGYIDLLEMVNVAFSIGSRGYARKVAKIGKSYFDKGEQMTKGRGYWSIEEIPEITQEMTDEMISDTYYY